MPIEERMTKSPDEIVSMIVGQDEHYISRSWLRSDERCRGENGGCGLQELTAVHILFAFHQAYPPRHAHLQAFETSSRIELSGYLGCRIQGFGKYEANMFAATKTSVRFFSSLMLWMVALLPGSAFSQISGDLLVQATDQTGAAVPNAIVTLTGTETGVTRNSRTDNSGVARFTQLNIGGYEIRVEAGGFANAQTRATVNSGGVATIPVALEVKASEQQVVVSESATAINTVNSQLQVTTETFKMTTLPLANTGVLGLTGTTPGVIPVTPRNPFLGLGSFNSNGGRGRGNNITVDNANATDVSTTGSSGLGTIPLDGIKEFNIITNNFNAEYGRNSSAQVQILTKNGTNEFHGSAFEFFRNDKLNARDYFDRSGKAAIVRDNQWGITAGLPFIKNKLFGFGTYEQQKIRGAGGTRVAVVPRSLDLATDPTSRQLLQTLQVPTDASGTVANPASNTTNSIAYSGRVDWNISSNDNLFVRFGTIDTGNSSAGLTFITGNLPTNGATSINTTYNATVSETHIFGASAVNQFIGAFNRSAPVFSPIAGLGAPEVAFSDGTPSFGIWSGLPQGRIQNVFSIQDTLTYTFGSHQIKGGAQFERIQANSFFDSNVRGTLTFTNLSEFLGGRPLQYSQRFGNSVRGNRLLNQYYFLQDDFRARRDLTINFGLRVEVAGGTSEVNNILSNLDLTSREPLGGAGVGPLGAFRTGGTYFNSTTNWGPRFGFSWNPGQGRWVVRGGYGIAYDFIFLNPITNGRFLPPYMYNFTLPNTDIGGANSYAAIVAGTSTFQRQGAATVGSFPANIRNFGVIAPIDYGLKNPQVQQWSLTVERDLGRNLVGRASYVGTKGSFLQRSRPINTRGFAFTPPQTVEEENARAATGEFRNLNGALNASLTASSNRIDPRFNAVTLAESSAMSNFHSLQLYVAKRFTGSYAFTTAYTYGKSIDDGSDVLNVVVNDTPAQQDPFNNRNNRGPSQFDVRQRLNITHNFQPQITKEIGNTALRAVMHGWEFHGSFQAQSGSPVNIFSGPRQNLGDATLLGGGGMLRPNVTGPVTLKFDANPGGVVPNKATGSGLAQPLVGQFGSLGRNVFRINPLIEAAWTVGRRFAITERIGFQLQGQIFNVFNNTTFSRPGNTLSNVATFGYYQDTDTDSRRVTLVGRFTW